ncbi:polysaccharide pyruvyl transferase CsaB [Tyzzerella sp. OttesenSCG-928-J15]|nr:polysaccharide pyruvyl transferase CsaB [Tyzzerella sp. OttesenSCG-928-J15]
MKVLHLISGGDKGGAKTAVFTLLSALNEEIEINVICFMEGVFYNEIQDMPIPSMLMKQKYRNDLTIIKPLADYIKKEGYDIVHAHGARANFISMFLKAFIKIPIITTVHSDYKLDFTDNLYKKYFYTTLNAIALRTVDYYIGVSNNFRNMLIERGFDENKVFAVYNTIDFEQEIHCDTKENFLKRFNINGDGKKLVGIIGRFDYVKGHDIFLNAAAEVLKKRKDVIFLMAGEGFEKPALEKQIAKLGIEENVVFTGFIDDIFSFINAIDINVCSSRSESFPYMLLEGALMKKPTVSAAVGGIPDLIKHDETGLLAESGDYNALAENILRYMNDDALCKKHGDALYIHAKSNFSRESMKRRHIEIYSEVLRREKEKSGVFDVMLSGYYGYSNSGDDALLEAVISALRKEKKDISIIVLSKKPQEAIEDHNVFSINRSNFYAIRKYMKRSRLFIYGGGSLIQDITSTQSLVYYSFLLWLARHYGLKLMVYGNGIGPVTKERNKKMARKALDICDYISLRDPESMNDIKELGVTNPNIHVSVDPVFSLEMENEIHMDEILAAENIEKCGKYFAVSLRPWQYNELNFTEKIASAVDHISSEYGLTPVFIPMNPMDIGIIKEVIQKLNCKSLMLTQIYGVSALMGIISHMEFAMCMRLHALIYATSVGVPVIGLDYDPKVRYFIEYINEKAYVNTSNLDVEALKQMAHKIMADPEYAKEKTGREAARLKQLSSNDAKEAVKLL